MAKADIAVMQWPRSLPLTVAFVLPCVAGFSIYVSGGFDARSVKRIGRRGERRGGENEKRELSQIVFCFVGEG